jgi:RNA polymerase sigma factor (sigma-70 family)
VASVVRRAAEGEEQAWAALVERFASLVWAVARGHGLGQADAADVSQTTWLRLAEQLNAIRDPERLGAWLATTARRESLRTLRRQERQIPVEECGDWICGDGAFEMVDDLVTRERDDALWSAFEALPPNCKALLRALLADPPPSYAELSDVFEMPIGSIGPTRARCLDRLRDRVEMHPIRTQGRRAVAGTSKGRVS